MKLEIDGKQVEFREGQTILEAASEAAIYIPTLCTLKELSSFGACRLCLVKVDGMRGFPPSCTTPASDGMIVTTDDGELKDLRTKILELLLSEHPNSCLVCEDQEICLKYRTCPMKVGQITGCQLCPSKENCGLRMVVDHLGVDYVDYEFDYKDLKVERSDPFFDRDYNICILCGRCVRVCQDVRGMGVLAFTNRGHETRIDTAFGKSHLELGCRFCGACVDACPTGALSARATKWHGQPEKSVRTICGLCSVGCGIKAETKWGKLVSATPDPEGRTNRGQLCMRGRFCIPSIVNSTERLKYPMVRKEDWLIPVSWDEAVSAAADGLKKYSPNEIAFVISPYLTNESGYLISRLAREVVGTDYIVIPGVAPGHPATATIDHLHDSNWVLVFVNGVMHENPLALVDVIRARKKGCKAVVVRSGKSDFDRHADVILNIEPSSELRIAVAVSGLLDGRSPTCLDGTGITTDQLDPVVEIMKNGKGTIMLAPSAFEGGRLLSQAVWNILAATGSEDGFMPLHGSGNQRGIMALVGGSRMTPEELTGAVESGRIKAVFATQALKGIEKAEFLAMMDVFESNESKKANVLMPVSAFTETSGTMVAYDGTLQRLERATGAYAQARHDCQNIIEIAEAMGSGFDYAGPEDVTNELMVILKGHKASPERKDIDGSRLSGFKVKEEVKPYHYRGKDLNDLVDDLKTVREAYS